MTRQVFWLWRSGDSRNAQTGSGLQAGRFAIDVACEKTVMRSSVYHESVVSCNHILSECGCHLQVYCTPRCPTCTTGHLCSKDGTQKSCTKVVGHGSNPINYAAIFSYVYLLLELDEKVWANRRLVDILKRFTGLGEHKELIRKNHFRARPPAVWRESH